MKQTNTSLEDKHESDSDSIQVLLAAWTVVHCSFSPRWFGTVNDDVLTY